MKSWTILLILMVPSLLVAQTKKPLSQKVEELLKAKKEKREREEAIVNKIGKDAVTEALENERQKNIKILKEKTLKKAVETRFVPKSPFLNYRPLPDNWFWKSTLSFSFDSYETVNSIKTEESSGFLIEKELGENHLRLSNEFQYSWTKKLLLKYTNTYHVFQTTSNDKHIVDRATVANNPDITNSRFGDHIFEANYRARREIFYGYDLDYIFRIVYPFGEALRAFAYPETTNSYTTSTKASQDGNFKSPFAAKAVFGIDYFSGKERSRYRYGGNIGYAAKGKYTINKGTGFFSTTPSGLFVDTESYVDTNFWFEYQLRPKVLKKTYYGYGVYGYFSFDRNEKVVTTGADGFSWIQFNTVKSHLKLNTRVWMKYQIKDHEHWEFSLGARIPLKQKINRRIIDEGADGFGNRQFFPITESEEISGRMPIELSVSYGLGF